MTVKWKNYIDQTITWYKNIPEHSPLNSIIHGSAIALISQSSNWVYHGLWIYPVAHTLKERIKIKRPNSFAVELKIAEPSKNKQKYLKHVGTAFFFNALISKFYWDSLWGAIANGIIAFDFLTEAKRINSELVKKAQIKTLKKPF